MIDSPFDETVRRTHGTGLFTEMDRPILHATVESGGAVVTEDVDDLAVVAGVPARVVRRRP